MKAIADLRVKLYADGADLTAMRALSRLPYIRGFTTNPMFRDDAVRAGFTVRAAGQPT
jgi:transaldolase